MRTVHKFAVPISSDPMPIAMPVGARIVHVGHQAEGYSSAPTLAFWAEIPDTHAERETRLFRVHGTGHPMPEGSTYVGTDLATDYMVWHLYEVNR